MYRFYFLMLLLAVPVYAAAPAGTEIDHLIDYVDQSGCTFLRNGSNGDAHAAAAHLRMKYRFAHGRVKTAEQFIDHIASKSSTTGEPYLVQCTGQKPQESGAWLRKELERARVTRG